jgi:hypothetical protein
MIDDVVAGVEETVTTRDHTQVGEVMVLYLSAPNPLQLDLQDPATSNIS